LYYIDKLKIRSAVYVKMNRLSYDVIVLSLHAVQAQIFNFKVS